MTTCKIYGLEEVGEPDGSSICRLCNIEIRLDDLAMKVNKLTKAYKTIGEMYEL